MQLPNSFLAFFFKYPDSQDAAIPVLFFTRTQLPAFTNDASMSALTDDDKAALEGSEALLQALRLLQAGDPNNVIAWAHIVDSAVVCAWPLSTPNGWLIMPTGIRDWLIARGLQLVCFCSAVLGRPIPCRIVESREHPCDVMAFCNSFPSVCGFYLNLSRIYKRSSNDHYYRNLHTLTSGLGPIDYTPQIERFRAQSVSLDCIPFLRGTSRRRQSEHQNSYIPGHSIEDLLAVTRAPYRAFTSAPPHVAAKASGKRKGKRRASQSPDPNTHRRMKARTTIRPPTNYDFRFFDDPPLPSSVSSASTPSISTSTSASRTTSFSSGRSSTSSISTAPTSVADGSSSSSTAGPSSGLSSLERRLLQALLAGDGVSDADCDLLLGQCEHCCLRFASSALQRHVSQCWARGLEDQ
ncbi:hypothetical protein NMY22_g4803 [Coprinellus aureogranulatus]|nr:hypothetical protein NMY22_g4803 [Coprinellus aureogranulatus]